MRTILTASHVVAYDPDLDVALTGVWDRATGCCVLPLVPARAMLLAGELLIYDRDNESNVCVYDLSRPSDQCLVREFPFKGGFASYRLHGDELLQMKVTGSEIVVNRIDFATGELVATLSSPVHSFHEHICVDDVFFWEDTLCWFTSCSEGYTNTMHLSTGVVATGRAALPKDVLRTEATVRHVPSHGHSHMVLHKDDFGRSGLLVCTFADA